LRAVAGDHIGLAEVERHRNHVVAGFDELFEEHRRVEAAGIREYDLHVY
jgi:hypothetical protein